MFAWHQYSESVIAVWATWAASIAVILCLTALASRRVRRRTAASLIKRQRGAAYTLSVVLLLPLYIVMIATVIECTMLLIVKLGTMHAAFAAARAASVWLPAEIDDERRMRKIHLAAGQAMVPYASSLDGHLVGIADAWTHSEADDAAYQRAMDALGRRPFPAGYLGKKRRYALSATRLFISVDEWRIPRRVVSPDQRVVIEYTGQKPRSAEEDSHAKICVTLTYEKPIDLPGVGAFLGQLASWTGARCYTRPISTSVCLEKEGPKSRNQKLGIQYDSWNY